jgi:PST family polysaccharide transporter
MAEHPRIEPSDVRPQGGIGRAAATGVAWTALGGIAERLIGFVALAVVVRLMTIEEAGIAMLAASAFDVILVVSTTGFGERIIQSPTADRVLQGTVFWLKIGVCSLLAVGFYLAAPWIAHLFGEPRVIPLLKVMAILIVTRAIPIVPAALMARSMQYGKLTIGTLISSMFSALAGIGVALAGYPIWALVAQFTASSLVYTAFAFVAARWLPPLAISPREAWRSIGFAVPLLASGSMNALSTQVSTLMIGAFLPIEAVAFYRIAARLFEVMGQVLVLPMQRVLLAVFSILRSDRARVEEALLNLLRVLAAASFAAYALVAAQGPDVMGILFGRTWMPSGAILAVLSIGVVGLVARSFVPAALTAVGRTRLVLLYTFVTTIATIVVVAIASRFSVMAVAAAQAGLLVATLPLSLLAFHLAFAIPPRRVAACLPLPLVAALAGAGISHLAAEQLASALPTLPPILRVAAAGLSGAIGFCAVHAALGPRRTRQTIRDVLALVRRPRASRQPVAG